MKYLLTFALFLGLTQSAQTADLEERCADDSARFERMNHPMFIGPKATAADVAAYEKNKDPATEALHQFLVQSILSELQRVGADNAIAKLPKWIDCVQSGIPRYAKAKDSSNNIPFAFALAGDRPRIAVGYSIDRGYEAISQVTYFMEVYSLEKSEWKLVASHIPHQFDAGSLTVSSMTDTSAGEQRFLLAGRHYGNTANRLYLELLGFDGRDFRELWSEVKPRTWVVRISQDRIVLGSEEVDKNGRNAHEVTRTFSIEKRGLDPVR